MSRRLKGMRGFAFSSGMAAIANVTHLLNPGDEILATGLTEAQPPLRPLYSPVPASPVRYVDASDPVNLAANVTPAKNSHDLR